MKPIQTQLSSALFAIAITSNGAASMAPNDSEAASELVTCQTDAASTHYVK